MRVTHSSPPPPIPSHNGRVLHPASALRTPLPFQHSSGTPNIPMHSTRSTHSTQQWSQHTRQQIAKHAEKDYYDCPCCQRLFPQYHGSHKRHIRSCIAKYRIWALEEARSQAERIETPTPDPYTPILSDAEVDMEDIGTGV